MAVAATIGNTIGAAFLGIIGSAILFGAIAVQVFTYYTHFPNDWRLQKISVGTLMGLAVIHLAFAIYTIYFYVIMNFGNLKVQESIDWSFKVQAALDIATILSVQGLYAWRIYILGKHFSRVWPWIVVAIVAVGWVIGIVLAVETTKSEGWAAVERFRSLLLGSYAVPMTIDAIIAGTLCYYLSKSRSAFTATNNRLLRIIHYVIICGFLTSACCLVSLICVATMPNTLIFVGINFLLPKLYLFSYMAMLNARKTITEKDSSSYNVSSVLTNYRQNSTWAEQPQRKPTITVETELTTDQDAIPLSPTKYYPGGKTSQRASLQYHNADLGV